MGSTQKSYANALRSRNEGQRAQTNPLPRESGISLGSNERRHVNQVPRKDQIIANLKTELREIAKRHKEEIASLKDNFQNLMEKQNQKFRTQHVEAMKAKQSQIDQLMKKCEFIPLDRDEILNETVPDRKQKKSNQQNTEIEKEKEEWKKRMTEQLRATIKEEFEAEWNRARLVTQNEDQLVAQNATNENIKLKDTNYKIQKELSGLKTSYKNQLSMLNKTNANDKRRVLVMKEVNY